MRYDRRILDTLRAAGRPLRHRELSERIAPGRDRAFRGIGVALTKLYRAGVLRRAKIDGRYWHYSLRETMKPNISEVDFLDLVQAEIERARVKHPTNIHNCMEGYAVIKEEMDEYWEECRKQNSKRDKDAMLKELVQIAAMCMRTAEDCGLAGVTR